MKSGKRKHKTLFWYHSKICIYTYIGLISPFYFAKNCRVTKDVVYSVYRSDFSTEYIVFPHSFSFCYRNNTIDQYSIVDRDVSPKQPTLDMFQICVWKIRLKKEVHLVVRNIDLLLYDTNYHSWYMKLPGCVVYMSYWQWSWYSQQKSMLL
jgi:hypothetical protein